MNFRAFKITAFLRNGVVTDGNLPIDGILAAAMAEKQLGEGFYENRELVDFELPLGKWKHVWQASFAQYELKANSIQHWNKRLDDKLDYLDDSVKKVEIGKGRYRMYHMPLFLVHSAKIEWYLFGDMAIVKELLMTQDCIGKKRSQGYGKVINWLFEECEKDYSIFDAEGNLKRHVPFEYVEGQGQFEKGYYGFKPPYWLPANQTLCAISGKLDRGEVII